MTLSLPEGWLLNRGGWGPYVVVGQRRWDPYVVVGRRIAHEDLSQMWKWRAYNPLSCLNVLLQLSFLCS